MLKVYQLIFQQGYDFFIASKQLEFIIQRIHEFIFMLYNKDRVYAILVMDDKYKDLFNNIEITLQEFKLDNKIFEQHIYARLKYKQHYAIPFCLQVEPFLLYKILADYTYSNNSVPLAFFMHVYQRNERSSIASYLRKHDIKRTSIYYAYTDQIRAKLQATHYHTTLLLASNSKDTLMKGLSAFKASYFTYIIRSNNHKHELIEQMLYKHIIHKPKRPLFNNQQYTVLSNIEIVSLMLPEVLLSIDGIRPYTTGAML